MSKPNDAGGTQGKGAIYAPVCTNSHSVGQNHSELPQHETWIVSSRGDLILIRNRVGTA